MQQIDVKQGTDAWHEFRRSGIGASESAAVLGLSPYKNIVDVFREKTERSFPTIANAFMQHGIETEPIARDAYEAITGKSYPAQCGTYEDYNFIIASFDGVCPDSKSIIEIKCPTSRKLFDCVATGDLVLFTKEYPYYLCQAQHQLLVCNTAEYCDFVVYLDGMIVSLRIERDDDFIEQLLLPKLIAFWNNNVIPDVEPELYVTIDDEDFDDLSLQYLDAADKAKEYDAKAKELKKRLEDFTDDGDCKGKHILMKRVSRETVDTKKLYSVYGIDDAVLSAYKKQSCGFYRITRVD